MQIADKYAPQQIESKWYDYWIEQHIFHSEPDQREPYTIVIPPPNVTGMLHMGHMLNNTLQDVLVRRARMSGKNACWVPGMDHASIATEAKVVAMLREKGIEKSSLTREEFLRHAWEWKEKYGGVILKQLRKLGASCDWDRTCFTMDEARTESVLRVFCDLYEKGKIYRGVRMVNWDPAAQTALSDEEVVFKESHGKLYYLRYKVEGTDRAIIVATTRPETILGDTALCVNPNDERYKALPADARVVVPLVGRSIPVIRDEYVDIEFGTGALKVTPAHDVNDYMLGEKYGLETIDIFNDDGTINDKVGMYVGQDRFDVRRQIEKDLDAAGLLEKTEDYTNNVGYSERTGVAIEPKHLPPLDGEHQGLVHLAPAVVGPAHSGVLSSQRRLRGGPDDRRGAGKSPREERRRIAATDGPATGRGRAGHVVLVVAVAHLGIRRHPLPGQQGNQLLLPHQRPGDGPRHHLLLGGPHDYDRV